MGERQMQGAGPVPVLEYSHGFAGPAAAEWRTLCDGVEFRIPAPAVGRQVVPPAAGLFLAIPLAFYTTLGTLYAALNSVPVATLLFGPLALGALLWTLAASKRLIRAARYGAGPTVITTSPQWLTLVSPWLPEDRPYRLPRAAITGVRLDEVNVLPAVVRTVRLRVVLRHEDFFDLKFPWRADFPLANAEWRLHDVLGLGPRNFSPPVAAVNHDTDTCESSS